MKRFVALLLCTLLCIAAFTACGIFKHEHTKSDWKYNEIEHWRLPECDRSDCAVEQVVYDLGDHIDENEDGTCDVCGYQAQFIFKLKYDESGYELDRVGPGYRGGDVVIPAEYRGVPVVEIGYDAFKSDYKLTSIVIPDTVTLISDDAFEKQTSLTSVNVGKGVVTIGVSAFEGCTNLKTVVICDATEHICAHAFDGCAALESVMLGKNVKEITGSVFEGCTNLKTITIPASIEKMGAWVFYDTNMTDIYFGVSAPGENWNEKWAEGLEDENIHWVEDCGEGNHTWDEGTLLTVPGSSEQQMVYHCTVCGKTKSENTNQNNTTENGGNGTTDVVDDGMVRTVLNGGGFGAPSLPYYVSTEIIKRCMISDRTISANIYLGHDWFGDSVVFSDFDYALSVDDLKDCSFTLVADYNGKKRVVVAENIDYASDLYDVTVRDLWEGDAYKGYVVNYSQFQQIDLDLNSMIGVSYGYVNIELRIQLPDGSQSWVMGDTLYYSVTDTEIVFGLVSNPIAHEGDKGIITKGWEYSKN